MSEKGEEELEFIESGVKYEDEDMTSSYGVAGVGGGGGGGVGGRGGNPADAVDEEKQKLVIRAGWDWMRKLGHPDILYRFDIVEVVALDGQPPAVNHIANAFTSAECYYL